ncbi:MAG: aromatic ring-hydroxylating dioxygenase subunit alpha [Planctomycetota bacterium]|nr:aromatic ring-hydroxylating dioxygenase subunit alpha [Planctomycetota bacterium]
MFISDTHLPQHFRAAMYHDADWYAKELEEVLLPSWYLVATMRDFPRSGSYRTFDLLGRPVILRREGDEIRGFLNVCSHRNSKLVALDRGCSLALKCNYHGWEYDGLTGDTRKIPDAPSFRPMKKGELGLQSIQVGVRGGLIFVSLGAEADKPFGSLFEAEGPFASLAERNLATGSLGSIDVVCPVNWKAAIENTLESYHVAEVHPHTFKTAPQEEDCHHTMFDEGSSFETPDGTPWFVRQLQIHALRGAKLPVLNTYRHVLLFPSFTVAETDSFTIFLSFLPEGPQQTRTRILWFAPQSTEGSRFRNAMVRFAARWESKFWLRVAREDFGVLPMVQQGIASPVHPSVGLISRREERIPHFQKWVLRKMGEPRANEA